MENTTKNIVEDVEAYVRDFFSKHIAQEYFFHDLQHTLNVVNAAREIGTGYNLDEDQHEILSIAAWFHDTGYDEGPKDHEDRSCQYAEEFLKSKDYPADKISKVHGCIMATKLPQKPSNLLEEILADSDMSHLGKKIYWQRCSRLRKELLPQKPHFVNDSEWLTFELEFLNNHVYRTSFASVLYGELKAKHIRQLQKQRKRLNPELYEDVSQYTKNSKDVFSRDKNDPSFQDLSNLNLGRGVETMYRTTYRTHVNLSSIADNKANIMLSINAIIVSIIISTLVPSLASNQKLAIPTILLLAVCLISIVFATLSTRPKITEGKFTREDIQNKKSNLLFFGNFYNMGLEDFQWGMTEMIKDQDFLYSSMTRDLYYLGVVLAKKYKYLSYCYAIFMYGLILSVIAFIIAYIFVPDV